MIDSPMVSNVVFYPRIAPIPNNLPDYIIPLNFKTNADISIGGYCYLNDKNLPNILFFHGNGEIALDYRYFYQMFLNCGINLTVMDFRGYGHSKGSPIYSGLISDALPIYKNFIDWIESQNMNKTVFIQGRSLGSVCAAEIGSYNPAEVKGIIFESGFASAYNIMTQLFNISGETITRENLEPYSNDTRIKKIQVPVLIIHGSMDWIIPKEEATLIFDNLPTITEKELILIEGATHNDILSYQQDYFTPLKSFIEKYKT